MPPTIKDVAKKAGVSLSTVSLVINNKSNISPETRQKVEQAILELDYHPRRNARGLAAKRTFNIGFILTDDHFSQAEPFYTKVFLGTEFEARQHHYYILLTTVPRGFREGSTVPRFLLERNVDGVIMAGRVPQGLINYVKKLKLPIVFVDYLPNDSRCSAVLIDNEGGAHAAVAHLIDQGHRQIAFLGGDMAHPSMAERLIGYKRALQERGLAAPEALTVVDQNDSGFQNGYAGASDLFARGVKPTAIFACNDAMAIGCLKYLQERGWAVPDDVSLIGFDDIEQDVLIEPRLTTIRVFKEELGAMALRRLVEMIDEKRTIVGQALVPVELVVRDSVRQLR